MDSSSTVLDDNSEVLSCRNLDDNSEVLSCSSGCQGEKAVAETSNIIYIS